MDDVDVRPVSALDVRCRVNKARDLCIIVLIYALCAHRERINHDQTRYFVLVLNCCAQYVKLHQQLNREADKLDEICIRLIVVLQPGFYPRRKSYITLAKNIEDAQAWERASLPV